MSTTVYPENCATNDSSTDLPSLLSKLPSTPQYMTKTDPPTTEYCGPPWQGNDS